MPIYIWHHWRQDQPYGLFQYTKLIIMGIGTSCQVSCRMENVPLNIEIIVFLLFIFVFQWKNNNNNHKFQVYSENKNELNFILNHIQYCICVWDQIGSKIGLKEINSKKKNCFACFVLMKNKTKQANTQCQFFKLWIMSTCNLFVFFKKRFKGFFIRKYSMFFILVIPGIMVWNIFWKFLF